jgi:ubiquinone/menaquinone biosynthesis C-methylase UbiE
MELDDKQEVVRQWDGDPCGAVTAAAVPPESQAWYDSIRTERYNTYAPWLPGAIDFERGKGKAVLEIGVGVGSDHYMFARAGARMAALDLSREHLRHTVKHLRYGGFDTRAEYGDAEAMPFPDASFDIVYSFGVLHHTPGTATALAEVYRVLRPGGVALIGLYHRDSIFFWLSTIFGRGIVRLGLLRKGWRQLLSEIEYRSAENRAVPLVKVYSRSQVRKLFSQFEDIRVSTHHVEASHFPVIGRWLGKQFSRKQFERGLRAGGWYIIIEAVKARS